MLAFWKCCCGMIFCYAKSLYFLNNSFICESSGAVRGGHLKKSRQAEGGVKIFGVFRVKNKKITILCKKIIVFPILGGGGARAGYAPHWIRPWNLHFIHMWKTLA